MHLSCIFLKDYTQRVTYSHTNYNYRDFKAEFFSVEKTNSNVNCALNMGNGINEIVFDIRNTVRTLLLYFMIDVLSLIYQHLKL